MVGVEPGKIVAKYGPGAWEQREHVDLYVGMLHTWSMHPDFMLAMLRLKKNILGSNTAVHYDFQHDKPYDLSRNFIAKGFLDSGAEWLLMVDTDILPPERGIEALYEHRLPIMGGLYWRRHPSTFAEVFRFQQGTTQYKPIPDDQIVAGMNEVDGMGLGFSLIHRRVFEQLKSKVRVLTIPSEGQTTEVYEFFKFAVAEPPFVSEDLYFTLLAKMNGWKMYVDARVQCGHVLESMMMHRGRPTWTPLEGGQIV